MIRFLTPDSSLRKEEKKNPQQLSEVVGRTCEIVIIK
jgi:hypothetical protein